MLEGLRSDPKMLVVVSRDLGADLGKKLQGVEYHSIDLSSSELGMIFGRDKLSVLAVADGGLAASISSDLIEMPADRSKQARGTL